MASLVEPNIEGLVAYVPGKPIEELKRELGLERAIKLASNENPLGASPAAVEAIQKAATRVNFYPDGGAFYLKEGLARHLDVETDELLVANGSNEAIELIVRTFARPGCRAVISESSFIVYKLASQAMGIGIDEVPMRDRYWFDLDAMADAIDPDTRFVFLANPNNPTGTFFERTALISFLTRVPDDVVVILDEAYFEYVQDEDYPNGLTLRDLHPHLVVLRTFSKCYGLAGLRVGYAVMSPEMVDYVNRVRAPFNTNLPGQHGALAALQDQDFVARSIEVNQAGLEQLRNGLNELGLQTIPSVTNFVLVKLPRPGHEVYEELLHRGIIVRPMAGYGLPDHVRVSVGLKEEIDEFLTALRDVLST